MKNYRRLTFILESGTIGLTIGGDDVTLVEINEHAVAEMQRNIAKLNRPNAKAIWRRAKNLWNI